MSVFAGSCSDLLVSKTLALLHEGQEEQTSFVQEDLGGCLPVVVLQDESAWPIFEFPH